MVLERNKKPISRLSDEQSNHKQFVAIQCRPGLRYRSRSWGTQVAYIILQSEKHTIPYRMVRIVSSCSTSAFVFPMHGTMKGFQNFCDATVHSDVGPFPGSFHLSFISFVTPSIFIICLSLMIPKDSLRVSCRVTHLSDCSSSQRALHQTQVKFGGLNLQDSFKIAGLVTTGDGESLAEISMFAICEWMASEANCTRIWKFESDFCGEFLHLKILKYHHITHLGEVKDFHATRAHVTCETCHPCVPKSQVAAFMSCRGATVTATAHAECMTSAAFHEVANLRSPLRHKNDVSN